ncbi:hypothetical protein [Gryllotalpicola protaetiae]|uniref:hypothetical protein n=1 Tax=Gryllotalpicola protaetiae TaxID=2419771 RepID=UPI0013C435C0|nr:hypothetical protein [Gryllotalpicola protaetiae]
MALITAGIITFNATTDGTLAEADEPAAATVVHQPTDLQSEALAWAESLGDFTTATHSGSGDVVVELPDGADAGILIARHQGDGDFAMTIIDADGESSGEQVVNTTGEYHGTTVWGLRTAPEASKTAAIQITADGDWSLIVAPLSAAIPMSASVSGDGDAVFLYDGKPGQLDAEHDGDAAFGVTAFAQNHHADGLEFTQTGPFTGESRFVDNVPAIIAVTATGAWTLTLA